MTINFHDLIRQCELAIYIQEGSQIKAMTEPEKARYRQEYGDADCVVGDYAIRKIRNRNGDPEQRDANVEAVRNKLHARAEIGLRKYGVTTERLDLSTLDFLRHAQEEAMDLAVYLQRLIRDAEERQCASVVCSCSTGPLGATQCQIHNR